MTLWTVARQAPLFMGFCRQEYWSGLLCPSPGDFPDPGIEFASPMSPASIDGFPGNSAGKKKFTCNAEDPGSIPGLGRSSGEGIGYPLQCSWASLVAQLVKNLPAMWETWVRSLGWEVFWPGEFHGLYSPWGCKESDTTERFSLYD